MEVERMEKIHRGNGFAIIEKDGEYQISWERWRISNFLGAGTI